MPTNTPTPRFLLHACARCHGDGILDADAGEYRCLQCGRTLQDAPPAEADGPVYRFASWDAAAPQAA